MDKILYIGKKTKSVYNTLSGLGYDVQYLELVSSAEDIVKFIVANADNAFAIIYDLSEFTFCVNKDNFAEIVSSVSKMAASTIQVVKGITANYKEYFAVAETLGIYNFLRSITTDDLIEEITKIFPNKQVQAVPQPVQNANNNSFAMPRPQANVYYQQPKTEFTAANNDRPQSAVQISSHDNYIEEEGAGKTEKLNQSMPSYPYRKEEKLSENNNIQIHKEIQPPVSKPKIYEENSNNIQPAPVEPPVQQRELSKKELREIKKREKLKAKEDKKVAKIEAKRKAVAANIQPMPQSQVPIRGSQTQFQPQPQQGNFNSQTVVPPVIPQQQMQHTSQQPPRPTKITTVGIIGIMPRIGTTTQAVMLTRYLNEAGIRACYVEENDTQFCDCLMTLYDDVSYDSDRDCLVKESLTLYKEETRSFVATDVAYRIVDYGYITKNGFPENYLKKDIKIIVCGTAPLEIANLISNVEMMYDVDLNYIFSLSDEQHYQEVLEVMGTKKDKCFLSPNIPDSFDFFTQPCRYIYNSILNLNIPPVSGVNSNNQKSDKKKKRWKR
ncbi:hypothetical protein [Ruminococcus sp.]|uniref:hypothetical protein n=1 Tax=Ruminococcus sp. TaxID=41978 RepID=UPI003AB8ABBE